ncbi:hypothetical protein BDV96DRAFT_597909 [Lophiotrema nucula]|uniref:Uncharacterized protein n=1 Tax=Lophiotrema nucula TaxID=690887 RepID=A0A6A5ZEZ8_9PLEO|nr:hypothetical protein BDV96DRAFT_597909 [Lophiotrema nucula]
MGRKGFAGAPRGAFGAGRGGRGGLGGGRGRGDSNSHGTYSDPWSGSQGGGNCSQHGGSSQYGGSTTRKFLKPKGPSGDTPVEKLKFPPERYYPPKGRFIDHTEVEDGLKMGDDNCGNCGEIKGDGHTNWRLCDRSCQHCHERHPGEACPLLYCSRSYWNGQIGHVPPNVQVRPGEPERLHLDRLPETNGVFRNTWFKPISPMRRTTL